MASVSLQIGIGLVLAIISQSHGATKCYKCVGAACHQADIPVEECANDPSFCAYSYAPHPDYKGRVEQRYCTAYLADSSTSCYNFLDKIGRECVCYDDLCNTEKIWVPRDGREFAASAVPCATPLLVILGSFVTLLIRGIWN